MSENQTGNIQYSPDYKSKNMPFPQHIEILASPTEEPEQVEINRGGRIIADDNEKITMSYRQFSNLKTSVRTLTAERDSAREEAEIWRNKYENIITRR